MRKTFEQLLERFGVEVQINGTASRAFLQFSNSKSWDSMNPIVTPLGQIPGGQYLYIGPVDVQIAPGDELLLNGVYYTFRRCEVYEAPEGPLYRWALCALRGGDKKWEFLQ